MVTSCFPPNSTLAQEAGVTRITSFNGTCSFELVTGFFPCDSKVAWIELENGRAILSFFADKHTFTVSGGSDRQPNLENYYLAIDTLRIMEGAKLIGEDKKMEGECHFRINEDATKFYSIKCDVYNRIKGTMSKFYLENIKTFGRADMK